MAQVIVITDPDLAPGYQLAGVETVIARSAGEARQHVKRLLGAGNVGVVAVHAPFLADMDDNLRREIEAQVLPVVISLPIGLETGSGGTHREQIRRMLRRAIGFEITFQPGESGPGTES